MRKLLIAFLILILAGSVYARMNGYMLGGGVVAGGVGDGAIGSLTHSTSRTYYLGNAYHSDFNTAEGDGAAGNVRYAHLYIADGNGNTICLSLHASDGTEILSCSGVASDGTAEWFDCDAGTTYEISDSTEYYLTIQASGNIDFYKYIDDGAGIYADGSYTYDCGGNISTGDHTTVDADEKISIIFDMTATR